MLGRNLIQAAAGNAAEPDIEWNVANASFDGTPKNFLALLNVSLHGIAFKTDGTKMFLANDGGANDIEEYSLSTAWDVSTAVFTQSKNIVSEDTNVRAVTFKSDGTKMYIVGTSSDAVKEYTLSTAWDVSTASYSQDFSVSAKDTAPTGVFFRNDGGADDGKQMYVTGTSSDSVHEYDLSTAWDVSTASFSQSFSVSSQDSTPEDVFFKSDGSIMYVVGEQGDDLYEYALSTSWDVSTASYSRSTSLKPQPKGVFFKSDGSRFFIVSNSHDAVYQYDLSTNWNLSTASYTEPTSDIFDVSSQDTAPVDVAFKSDGSKMYVVGNDGDDVNEYDLSTDWDVDTASYSQNFSVAAQEIAPQSIAFKSDGSKMYILGNAGNDVNEYDLSTAWDVSTASYNQNFSVLSQDNTPRGLAFKTDGTKMYVTGDQNANLYEYDLSTAWDISTASYNQSYNLGIGDSDPRKVVFKSDGTRMFMAGRFNDRIRSYDLSTAWDISTAILTTNTFPINVYEGNVEGIDFKPDGTKFFIVGSGNDIVWAFNIS
jgi:hypothetical protein